MELQFGFMGSKQICICFTQKVNYLLYFSCFVRFSYLDYYWMIGDKQKENGKWKSSDQGQFLPPERNWQFLDNKIWKEDLSMKAVGMLYNQNI